MTSFLTSLYFNMELTKAHRAEIVKLDKQSQSAKMFVRTMNKILSELKRIDIMTIYGIVRDYTLLGLFQMVGIGRNGD